MVGFAMKVNAPAAMVGSEKTAKLTPAKICSAKTMEIAKAGFAPVSQATLVRFVSFG